VELVAQTRSSFFGESRAFKICAVRDALAVVVAVEHYTCTRLGVVDHFSGCYKCHPGQAPPQKRLLFSTSSAKNGKITSQGIVGL